MAEAHGETNRRRALRIPVASMAHITPHGLQKTTDILIRDLSTEGMGCYSKHIYEKGDILLIKIKLDAPEGEVVQDSLMGRVIWVKEIDTEKQYAVGVEFREMETRNPELYSYLKKLEQKNVGDLVVGSS